MPNNSSPPPAISNRRRFVDGAVRGFHAYANWLMTMRRPPEWNQWSEAVWREPRTPKFIGDMPHGWVASDFMRATLDMLAYEREADSTLVVGAGIPIGWARSNGGVAVTGLRTWWGALEMKVQRSGASTDARASVRVVVSGVRPPGGIELHAPFGVTPREVLVDGVRGTLNDEGRTVKLRGPATVEFRY